jgi:hypothetical protein
VISPRASLGLRQRNTPATPDHSAAFWREDFKDSLFISILF